MKKFGLICGFAVLLMAFWYGWIRDDGGVEGEAHEIGIEARAREAFVRTRELKFAPSNPASDAVPRGDVLARGAGAVENERTLRFPSAAARDAFLARAVGKVRILGRLDALNALHVGFSDPADLASAMDGEGEEGFVFPVFDPAPPEGSVQPGAVALGASLLPWLGVTGDNSNWGAGVKVAVLDTGVIAHPALAGKIERIDLVAGSSDGAPANGHGTAVASLIAGNSAMIPGVAPGVELLSVRIAGDNGMSNSFLLSQGIIAAMERGAELINISMGSHGDSALVRDAIALAVEKGALVIAASGNNGLERVSYPAANDGVIAVGAVDATGSHLDFSNSGDEVALAAPGYAIHAAWLDGQAVAVTGTSFSAPIVTGALAAIMTESGSRNLNAAQSYQRLIAYLNDTGTAGADATTGGGMPDLARALAGNTPGIFDAAIGSASLDKPSPAFPNGRLRVLVQNRGTEPLLNTSLNVHMGAGNTAANITSLAPNQSREIVIPIPRPAATGSAPLHVETRVALSDGVTDARPRNDSNVRTYLAGDR
ncbi:MAG: S8 family serine peptidase [Verrucomicrobiota bacterium]